MKNLFNIKNFRADTPPEIIEMVENLGVVLPKVGNVMAFDIGLGMNINNEQALIVQLVFEIPDTIKIPEFQKYKKQNEQWPNTIH
jgi:hypothetical protein